MEEPVVCGQGNTNLPSFEVVIKSFAKAAIHRFSAPAMTRKVRKEGITLMLVRFGIHFVYIKYYSAIWQVPHKSLDASLLP